MHISQLTFYSTRKEKGGWKAWTVNKEVAIAGVTSAPHGSANPPLDTVHTVLAQQHWWGDWEDRIGIYEEGSSNVFQTFFLHTLTMVLYLRRV